MRSTIHETYIIITKDTIVAVKGNIPGFQLTHAPRVAG